VKNKNNTGVPQMRCRAPHEALMFFGYFLVSRQESNRGWGQSPKQN